MYADADDTKIWKQMDSLSDHLQLQRDIDYLFDWALKNKMKFHPSKCKVLMVSKFSPPLLDILPFVQFFYKMGDSILEYTETEKDLGIPMNRTLNFTEHSIFFMVVLINVSGSLNVPVILFAALKKGEFST